MARNASTGKVMNYEAKKHKSKQRRTISISLPSTTKKDNDKKVGKFVIRNASTIRRTSLPLPEESATTVLRREKEYGAIKQRVEAFIKYGAGAIIYLTGVPGSGKTHTVKKIFQSLAVPYSYVNCSQLKSKAAIFSAIGDSLACCGKASLQLLRSHFHSCEEHHFVIIDEVDFLQTKNELILYNLFELPFVENAHALLIVISNTLGSLGSKTESRVGKERIEFKPYSSEDLQVILSEGKVADLQANNTNKKGPKKRKNAANPSINSKSLELISKRVASSTGDIRKAIELVNIAGGAGIDVVDAIIKEMAVPLLAKFVRSLSYYQKLILFLNYDSGKDLLEWFSSFKTFCKLKSIMEVDFICFREVVEDLSSFGMFKISGVRIKSQYYKEEFERAMKKDEVFQAFR